MLQIIAQSRGYPLLISDSKRVTGKGLRGSAGSHLKVNIAPTWIMVNALDPTGNDTEMKMMIFFWEHQKPNFHLLSQINMDLSTTFQSKKIVDL